MAHSMGAYVFCNAGASCVFTNNPLNTSGGKSSVVAVGIGCLGIFAIADKKGDKVIHPNS